MELVVGQHRCCILAQLENNFGLKQYECTASIVYWAQTKWPNRFFFFFFFGGGEERANRLNTNIYTKKYKSGVN